MAMYRPCGPCPSLSLVQPGNHRFWRKLFGERIFSSPESFRRPAVDEALPKNHRNHHEKSQASTRFVRVHSAQWCPYASVENDWNSYPQCHWLWSSQISIDHGPAKYSRRTVSQKPSKGSRQLKSSSMQMPLGPWRCRPYMKQNTTALQTSTCGSRGISWTHGCSMENVQILRLNKIQRFPFWWISNDFFGDQDLVIADHWRPLHQHPARCATNRRTPSRSGIHTRRKGMPGSWSPKAVKTSTGPFLSGRGFFSHLRDQRGMSIRNYPLVI